MKQIRKIIPFVLPYWKFSLLALFLLTSVVFMDLAIPRLIQRIIDQGIKQKEPSVVLHTALVMLGISALSALFAVGNNIFSVRVGESVGRDMREAMFIRIQSFSFGNLDQFSTGKLMVRLTSDTSAVQRLVQITLRIGTRAPMLMIGSLILMFNTDQRLAFTIVPLLLITSVVIIVFSLKMEPLFRAVQQKLDWLNIVLQENIAGARLVKAFDRAAYEDQRFETANENFTSGSIHVMQFMSSMSPLLTIFVNIGIVVVVWAGGLQSIRGEMTLGQIVAFTNYLLTTMTPLIMMTQLSNVWANGIASAQRINEVLDATPQVPEAPGARALPVQARDQVAFRNVSFKYESQSDETVLEGVDLVAEPGQTVAILGATGAGKSSLVNLIPRYYDVTGGQVLIDGIDVRSLREDSLLAHIGIVPQESILFSGTLRDNIRYGRPDATEAEVIAAAQAAQAHDFIMELPDGYDSHVEARGANLSGGQKQRVAIARALLTKPRILILDDSTSSVDVETEIEIQAALDVIMHERTSFVVAQRISTVLNADKIIILDRGRVVAQGNHAELLKSSPVYQEIYESQLGNGFREADLAGEAYRRA